MSTLLEHRIWLSKDQIEFIQSALGEARFGASNLCIQKASKVSDTDLELLDEAFKILTESQSVLMRKDQWRQVYDLLHGVLYGLGSFELQTLTGANVALALNTNLLIASKLWGVYAEAKF